MTRRLTRRAPAQAPAASRTSFKTGLSRVCIVGTPGTTSALEHWYRPLSALRKMNYI